MAAFPRRKSVAVDVGGVLIGGNNPIVVQSMTNTDTANTATTVNQTMALAKAGSEIVRITVNTDEAARAVPVIAETLYKFGVKGSSRWRLPLQRSSSLKEVPRLRQSTGEVPHQSGQR